MTSANFYATIQATQTSSTAKLRGTELGYWDTNTHGHPVIFMHSGVQSALAWGHQRDYFANNGYRAIGYSRRGYHGSSAIDPQEPGVAAEDLEALMDFLQVPQAHIVALAHGGFFALDFTLSYPEKVLSLTVASSMMGIEEPEYLLAQSYLRPPFFEELPIEFKELGPAYRATNFAGVDAWKRLALIAQSHPTVSQQCQNRLDWSTLGSIRRPVLLMSGDADLYVPPPILRMQANHISNATAVVIKESGHCPNWERPMQFNHTLLEFLNQHNPI